VAHPRAPQCRSGVAASALVQWRAQLNHARGTRQLEVPCTGEVALQQQWQAMRVNGWCGRGQIIGDERKGRGVGRESPYRRARLERRSSTDGLHRHPGPTRQWRVQRRARAGRVGFTDRANLEDSAHEDKWFFFFPIHFPFNTEVEIILGKILRDLTKLWEFS
jgi:hypothetical protein